MPRSAAPAWRLRKEPVLDEYIRASIREAGGKCDPATGFYATLVIHGIESREDAAEVVRALHRSALWLHRNTDLNCTVRQKVVRRRNGYAVEFTAVNKDHARAFMIRQYGDDPTRWPYSTSRFHPNYGS